MALGSAQLQQRYRNILLGFAVLVLLVVGGTVYAGWSRAVIEIIPAPSEVSASVTLTVDPAGSGPNGLTGTVTIEERSASVTVEPSGQGITEPAQATGIITIHNDSGSAQPLASGTRLESETGVIVRTVARVDVPARGTVEIEAVADPRGIEGEIPPGRLTIVALRPANQALIYGMAGQSFTGGQVTKADVLSIDDLTTASHQAQDKILSDFGDSQTGFFRTINPLGVETDPPAETASASYTVTVTVQTVEVQYSASQLDALVLEQLTTKLGDDQELAQVAESRIRLEELASLEQAILIVTGSGQAVLRPDSQFIQPEEFVQLNHKEIETALLGSKLIDSVNVTISPWWQTTAPSKPGQISVVILQPDLTNQPDAVDSP